MAVGVAVTMIRTSAGLCLLPGVQPDGAATALDLVCYPAQVDESAVGKRPWAGGRTP
jgi:hypothetical protein